MEYGGVWDVGREEVGSKRGKPVFQHIRLLYWDGSGILGLAGFRSCLQRGKRTGW